MAYEPKDMSGSLFKNDRKEKDTHPDYKGSALVDGVDMWMSGWIKQDRNGKSYMSVSFQRKDARTQNEPPPRRVPPRQQPRQDPISSGRQSHDMDDEIPFSPEFR